MGASLEKYQNHAWKPLEFFSRSFKPTQNRYSTYDREFTACYKAVKHFKYDLERREFYIVTGHKPLTYAFSQKLDKASPRQHSQLSFLSQFTTTFEYISGSENVTADSLSRVDLIRLATDVDLLELLEAKKNNTELQDLLKDETTSLNLRLLLWGAVHTPVVYDLSGEVVRPYVPQIYRRRIFDL